MQKIAYSLLCLVMIGLWLGCRDKTSNPAPAKEASGQEKEIFEYLRKEVNPLFSDLAHAKAGKKLDSIGRLLNEKSTYGTWCTFWRFKGIYHTLNHQYDSAEFYLRKSYDLALAKDTTKKHLIGATIQYADLYKAKRDLPEALKYAREAYDMSDKKDSGSVAFICMRLSDIYSSMKNVDLAYRYDKEGFRISNQPRYKMAFANNISKYYDNKDEIDSAVRFFKVHVMSDTSFKHPYYNGIRDENYGVLLVKKGDFHNGLAYQQKAMNLYKSIDMESGSSYFNLADAYAKLLQYSVSNKYLDTALRLSMEEKDASDLKDIWSLRSRNLNTMGQHKEAYRALDSAYHYYKREVDESLTTQAEELETKYEVKVKDQQIELLTVSNAANNKIARQNKIIAIALTCLMILPVIVLVLLARRRKLKQQLKQAELEQQLLRSQMEPHFIFNTLSVLQGLIRNGEKSRAVGYLNKFAGLLRLNLKNSRSGLVLLSEEVEALKHYLGLQETRFEGAFDYEINVYDGYEDDEIMVPPMLIQPFVENAIDHGLRNISYKGELKINILKPEEELVYCKVEDNGCGIEAGKEQGQSNSLSTAITRERLAILGKKTGRKASLVIQDRKIFDQVGTIVELTIPGQ